MSEQDVKAALAEFVACRDWDQFHTVPNLIKSISIEAAELLELVQWDDEVDLERLREELADVLTYCHLLAAKVGIDTEETVLAKLEKTKAKYPVEKARGNSLKYDELHD
jgi:NTP pyrophosphatase (non-canonical NTP hydrolase)